VVIILYVWSRKNQGFMIHIMGIFPIQAPYLTWFFMLMNIMMGESVRSDLVGIFIGHAYYFMADVLPKLPSFKGM
jgi:Derlin-2/3